MRSPWKSICALAAVALLAACSDDSEPASSSPPQESGPREYVALGDSYAAMGSRSAETTGPAPCVRSVDNYPSMILASDDVVGEDHSCSGAQTPHVTGPWEVGGQTIPPQIDAIANSTQLITLSIGGNDIGFGTLAGCFQDVIIHKTTESCQNRLSGATQDQLDALPAKLEDVYAQIKQRAPHATIVTTGYFPMVSSQGECSPLQMISKEDRDWITGVVQDLNATIEQAASQAGAIYVLPEQAEQHTACAAHTERWVDTTGLPTDSYPMHPTALGQEAMAEAVLRAI